MRGSEWGFLLRSVKVMLGDRQENMRGQRWTLRTLAVICHSH